MAQPTDTLAALAATDTEARSRLGTLQVKRKELADAQVAFDQANQRREDARHAHFENVNKIYPQLV